MSLPAWVEAMGWIEYQPSAKKLTEALSIAWEALSALEHENGDLESVRTALRRIEEMK